MVINSMQGRWKHIKGMLRYSYRFLSFFAFLLGLCSFETKRAKADYGDVIATIPPIAALISEVARDSFRVKSLVPAGSDPHGYELKASDLILLSKARLIFAVGGGFEPWPASVVRSFGYKSVWIAKEAFGEDKLGAEYLHLWLTPIGAATIVEIAKEVLCRAKPRECPSFKKRAWQFQLELKAFDDKLRREIASWEIKRFIAQHPAWGAFARHYGLVQSAVLFKREDISPGVKTMSKVHKVICDEGVRVAFLEHHSHGESLLETISEDYGLRKVLVNPIGEGGDRYFEFMEKNLKAMQAAMRKE